MKTFLEYLNLREDAASLGWYLVNSRTSKPHAGPYKTSAEARMNSKFKNWYDPKDYDILYGRVNNDVFEEVEAPQELGV